MPPPAFRERLLDAARLLASLRCGREQDLEGGRRLGPSGRCGPTVLADAARLFFFARSLRLWKQAWMTDEGRWKRRCKWTALRAPCASKACSHGPTAAPRSIARRSIAGLTTASRSADAHG